MLDPSSILSSIHQRRVRLSATHTADPNKKIPHPAPHAAMIFADTATLDEIRPLFEAGIINGVTTNPTQAFWAAQAGALYVSPFLGRLADYAIQHDEPELPPGNSLYWVVDPKNEHGDQRVFNSEYVASDGPRKDAGVRLIHEIATIFANYDIQSLVLAASLRNPVQITECLLAGADILTVPAPILQTVADHPLSDAGMKSFNEDAQVFTK